MEKKRFYYNHSLVYGWCVYDRWENAPAYEACCELLPPIKEDESGTICESPICETEYQAMRMCTRLNVAWKRFMTVK